MDTKWVQKVETPYNFSLFRAIKWRRGKGHSFSISHVDSY